MIKILLFIFFVLSFISVIHANAQSGCGPYENADNDLCGDVSPNTVTYELITLNLLCQPDANNKLAASFCTVWDNQASLNCYSYNDLKPGTGSKCKCSQLTIGNVDVVLSGLSVSIVNAPTCYVKENIITFFYKVENPTSIPLSTVTITDTLGTSIHCCSNINSTSCPRSCL